MSETARKQAPHNAPNKCKPNPRLAYKVGEAAEMLGVSPSTLRKMARRGDLNVITSFGPWLISRSELDRLMEKTLR